jgi:hypothetical protein
VLCEALATGTPMTVVPMNLEALAAAGVTFVDVHTGQSGRPAPIDAGSAAAMVAAFDPSWAVPARPGG